MLLDYLGIALNGVKHRKRRTLLTVIGVVIGVLAIVSLVSIGQGLQDSLQRQAEAAGSDAILISASGGSERDTVNLFDADDTQAVRATRGVEAAAPNLFGGVRAEYQGEQAFLNIRAGPLDREKLIYDIDSLELLEGRLLRSSDTGSAMVVRNVAENSFDKEVRLGTRLEMANESYTVVGIVERGLATGTRSVYLTEEEGREVLGRGDGFGSIVAKASGNISQVEERIQRNLRDSRDVEEGEEDFNTVTFVGILESFNSQISQVQGLLLGLGGISVAVGAVGIMNTMYTSVTQRTHEIGVMKAIGASRRQILTVFLFEAGLIGAVGGLLGAMLGTGLSTVAARIISDSVGLEFSAFVGPSLFAGGALFGFVVGSVAGTLPARKASKLPPAEALDE
jgi:putative ABC transport system permease protein